MPEVQRRENWLQSQSSLLHKHEVALLDQPLPTMLQTCYVEPWNNVHMSVGRGSEEEKL